MVSLPGHARLCLQLGVIHRGLSRPFPASTLKQVPWILYSSLVLLEAGCSLWVELPRDPLQVSSELIRKIADGALLPLLPPPPLVSKNIQPTLNLKLAKIKQSPEAQSPIRMGKKKKKKQNCKASLSEASCGSEWFCLYSAEMLLLSAQPFARCSPYTRKTKSLQRKPSIMSASPFCKGGFCRPSHW